MVFSLIILGLMVAFLLFFNRFAYSLEIISALSRVSKIADVVLLAIGLTVAFVAGSHEHLVVYVGIYLAFVGIQQEIFKDMREKFVAYVAKRASQAVFVPKMLIDGVLMVEVFFEDDACEFWAVYSGDEDLEIDQAYEGLGLCVVFNSRGEPDYLCCA